MRNGLSQSTYDQIITYFLGQSSVYIDSMNLSEWHIYGSSRLGIYQTSINMAYRNVRIVNSVTTQETNTTVTLPSYTLFSVERGSKRYELTNHLGNILAVVSDKKIQVCTSTAISYYVADLVCATDYSPFGAPLAGRTYTAPNISYRFAFNGQEKDDEVSGAVNTMSAEFWEYDARLGRRWNLDPKPNVWESHYSVMGGNPICMTDVNGDKWKNLQDCEKAKDLNSQLEKKKNSYKKSADKLEKRAKRAERRGNREKANELREKGAEQRRGQNAMAESQLHLKAMEGSSEIFTFGSSTLDGRSETRMEADGTIVLGGETDADYIHESVHGYQHLYGNTQLTPGGRLKYSDLSDERKAYVIQYFFSPSTVTDIGNRTYILKFSSKDITNQYVADMYYINYAGEKVYGYDYLLKYGDNERNRPNSHAFNESIIMNQFKYNKVPFILK